MPFSIRRFTLRRSLSSSAADSGNKNKNYKSSTSSTRSAHSGEPIPSSRSVDQNDLRRLNDHNGGAPPQLPPRGPPRRAVSIDRNINPHSASILSRWRAAGKSKTIQGDTQHLENELDLLSDHQSRRPRYPGRTRHQSGVRFQESDGVPEDNQSGSSTDSARLYYMGDRREDGSSDRNNGQAAGAWQNTSGENGSVPIRRPQPRRHHTVSDETDLENQRTRIENAMSQATTGATANGQQQNRGPPYRPPASIYDEDPGIMSEVETSATGFRRSNKARSTLPVVRTPNKSQERPLGMEYAAGAPPGGAIYAYNDLTSRSAMMMSLGLVFLQYRNETKRALLPNEITSLDTVKALFVRSFPKQLTMEYLDSPHIRIYIHDPTRDMFYELEELRDIRDRCVLRIYEHDVNGVQYSTFNQEQDLSYFSEPEFDSDYQNQHIHRSNKIPRAVSGYYGMPLYANRTQTLPHSRPYSPAGSERGRMPPMAPMVGAYSQTLPRGMTYSTMPIAPDKRKMEFPMSQSQHELHAKVQEQRPYILGGAPPKPQRASYPPPLVPMLGSPTQSQPVPLAPTRSLSPDRMGYPTSFPSPQGAYPYPYSPERGMGRPAPDPYLSSPERRVLDHHRSLPVAFNSAYEEPFYGGEASATSGYMTSSRSGSVTPIVDEEARMRMEHMERQLASLTGLVQKALTASPRTSTSDGEQRSASIEFGNLSQFPPPPEELRQAFKAERPTKPAIKTMRSHSISDSEFSSGAPPALPDRDGRPVKPPPPPKPASLSAASSALAATSNLSTDSSRQNSLQLSKDVRLSPEMCSQLRHLRKQTKDLRTEVRNLRRMAQAQAVSTRETVRDTCTKLKAILQNIQSNEDKIVGERVRVSRDEESYRQDIVKLEKDLADLESQVEELRSNVINRRCRVNMNNVESMALVLSRASKCVADLKVRFPKLQEHLKTVMAAEMEVVVREEKLLKEEPERLENALRRCKKLTGTLVTLKRLAIAESEMLSRSCEASPVCRSSGTRSQKNPPLPMEERIQTERDTQLGIQHGRRQKYERFANNRQIRSLDSDSHSVSGGGGSQSGGRGENALDALLDELQTFSASNPASARLPPTTKATNIVHPQVITMNPITGKMEISSASDVKRATTIPVCSSKKAPPPPPRTTSKSPATSPTQQRSRSEPPISHSASVDSNSNQSSSSSESVNSQEGLKQLKQDSAGTPTRARQELLEQRHQELLKKQRLLQEQYARLQLLQRLSPPKTDLKKTGSESNILSKATLTHSSTSGSLTHLATAGNCTNAGPPPNSQSSPLITTRPASTAAGAKFYETDIL